MAVLTMPEHSRSVEHPRIILLCIYIHIYIYIYTHKAITNTISNSLTANVTNFFFFFNFISE